MKIYLMRHGLVENPGNVLYGRLPGFHLSAEGRKQIKINAQKLKNRGIKKIYSSPMERSVETAEILKSELGLKEEIKIDEKINEVDCGKWEGKVLEDFRARVKAGDIESPERSGQRVLDFIKEIIPRNEDAIIVSHGDPIMGALSFISSNWNLFETDYIKKGDFRIIEVNGKEIRLLNK